MDIEDVHKQYLTKSTMVARAEFLGKRRTLFARLDTQLSGMARFGSGLKNEGSIKKMLGISSKSYWHHGEIRRYEERVKRVAKASQMLKKGTYVGIALDVGATALEITEACSTGREQAGTQAKYVEGGKLVLGVSWCWGLAVHRRAEHLVLLRASACAQLFLAYLQRVSELWHAPSSAVLREESP